MCNMKFFTVVVLLLTAAPAFSYAEDAVFKIQASNDQQQTIKYILTQLSTKNVFSLMYKQRALRKKGKIIANVSTLDFLAIIFRDKELISHLQEIRESYFKWDHFLAGVAGGMDVEVLKDDFSERLLAFATFTKARHNMLVIYAERGDWEGFIHVLLCCAGER